MIMQLTAEAFCISSDSDINRFSRSGQATLCIQLKEMNDRLLPLENRRISESIQYEFLMALEKHLENLRLEGIDKNNGNCVIAGRQSLFSDEGIAEQDLVDIKEFFVGLGSNLQPRTIIKDPNFNLFEGTHSLEVDNKKLDSSKICLTIEEVNFDCNVSYGEDFSEQLGYVTAIVDKLVKFLVCWLNDYQTLPTTVLSCRYVEYLLTESSKVEKLIYFKSGNLLHDRVLCSAIYGICYFAKFIQKLLKAGVIFEEEDLNFNNMGLEFLSYVGQEEIFNSLHKSMDILRGYGEAASPLLHLLKLIDSLISIEGCLTDYSANTAHLDRLVIEAEYLDKQKILTTFSAPVGSFSMGIQKRLPNQFPPKNLVVPSHNYQGFVVLAEDLKIVLKVDDAKTMLEAMQFAEFFNKLTQRHIIARAVFPLFFIRDDHTILGKFTTSDFIRMHLLEFSLMSTVIEKESPDEMEVVLNEAINVLFEWYQNTAQNTSRYREGYNRQLLLWDSLQAQMESVEVDLESQGISDIVNTPQSPVPLLPYTSWAFVMKVNAMVEFVLKGFDLQLYKPFESYTMFWYCYYLSYQLESCLDKVQKFIDTKINAIYSLNKKLKKSKAGEKKEKLRAQYRNAMDTEMGQLQTNKRYISFLFVKCTINKSLSLAQVFQFAILKSFGVIDNKSPSTYKFTNDELLHNLRLKPFCSIGVPELLPYEVLESTLNDFLIDEPMFSLKFNKTIECMNKELKNTSIAIETVLKCIQTGDDNGLIVTGTRLVKDQSLEYYNRLLKSVQAIELNSKMIRAKLSDQRPSKSIRDKYAVELKCVEGALSFYPLLDLIEKKNIDYKIHTATQDIE